ncbi:Arc family DNA-binding protein [Vibrio fluvialis]|nr:Arc family DNA-binding protein [Vibrio fluvialis]
MAREDDKFTVRMPPGMREKLSLRAKSNNRSTNAEYVQILQDALNEPVKVSGCLDESEKLADRQAEEFKQVVFETLKSIYKKDK